MNKLFHDELQRLCTITAKCREDMHEPDEQGISAVFGPSHRKSPSGMVYPVSLDNACMGEQEDMGFWLVDENTREAQWFNLAGIIALARKALL